MRSVWTASRPSAGVTRLPTLRYNWPMSRTTFLGAVAAVVCLDYVAQVPYYLHQYAVRSHAAPSAPGVALLAVTLLWFVLGVVGLWQGSAQGYWLLVAFLAVECLFLSTNAGRAGAQRPRYPAVRPSSHGRAALRRVRHRLRQSHRCRRVRLLPPVAPHDLPRVSGATSCRGRSKVASRPRPRKAHRWTITRIWRGCMSLITCPPMPQRYSSNSLDGPC